MCIVRVFCKRVSSISPVHCSSNILKKKTASSLTLDKTMKSSKLTYNVFVVQSLSLVRLFVTPWTAAHLSFSISLPFTCNVYMIYHSGLICISLIALRLNHLNIGIPFSVN